MLIILNIFVFLNLGCAAHPIGVSNSANIRDQRFSASSSLRSSSPINGRLKGASAWIPENNSDPNDYLQIDLGSVYFVCGVATQGNPVTDDWTKTYKIETSLDNVNWKFYSEDGAVKVLLLVPRALKKCIEKPKIGVVKHTYKKV